jgi:superfamily I DNA/RNA helicase
VGGGRELLALAEAAADLQAGRRTSHPELWVFKTWQELREYSTEDGGADLKVFVNLVDQHGPDALICALSRLSDEHGADLMISTAHRSKGREWDRVRIHDDYPQPKEDAPIPRADAMLAYVAVTRARRVLDRTGLAWIDEHAGPDASTPAGHNASCGSTRRLPALGGAA